MAEYQNVFERYEKKYMLDQVQYSLLRQALKEKMQEDQYGLHTIGNIYYDTEDYELIRTSLEKPVYKEKLRLRSYGTPRKDSVVFVELKKKYAGVVYKRRTGMELSQAQEYLKKGMRPDTQEPQILNEIDWFLKQHMVSAKIYIAYDRIALAGKEDASLRITFDRNLRYRRTMLDLSRGDWGHELLEEGKILMEVKISQAMPLWLSRQLSKLEIYPVSFSKYGECYRKYLKSDLTAIGGIICA